MEIITEHAHGSAQNKSNSPSDAFPIRSPRNFESMKTVTDRPTKRNVRTTSSRRCAQSEITTQHKPNYTVSEEKQKVTRNQATYKKSEYREPITLNHKTVVIPTNHQKTDNSNRIEQDKTKQHTCQVRSGCPGSRS